MMSITTTSYNFNLQKPLYIVASDYLLVKVSDYYGNQDKDYSNNDLEQTF